MKTGWYESFGEAEHVLISGDKPKPQPAPGEVLIKIKFSAVNPSDVKKRLGAFPGLLDKGFIVPNSDGSGVIESVGIGVASSRIGERVWVYQAQFGRRFGTTSEYIAIDSLRAVHLPDNTSLESGACLGIPAMTAHRCVFADGPVNSQKVLITGGAGRVGNYSIQWAKQAGATVITTASNEKDTQYCKDSGADYVVNHRSESWPDELLDFTRGDKIDRVIDVEFGANLTQVLKVIRTGGVIATYGSAQVKEPTLPFTQMMFMDLMIRMVIVYSMPEQAKQAAIRDINKYLREDRLNHRIAHCISFENQYKAHEIVEQGSTGGSVLIEIY